MKRTSAISIIMLALSFTIYGCGNTDSALSARQKISSPSEALIGHWAEEFGDANLYFDGEHFLSFIEGSASDQLLSSWSYQVINEDPEQFVVEIEVDLVEGITPRILRIEFSDDRNGITMKYWEESEQEFIETELSKDSIIYVDDKLSSRKRPS